MMNWMVPGLNNALNIIKYQLIGFASMLFIFGRNIYNIRENKVRMNKFYNNRKGFTLAELLIVVAIIAVLVAIAIPVFASQLEKSREATDLANVRSAYAEVMVEANTDPDSEHMLTVGLKQAKDNWDMSQDKLNIGGVTIESPNWIGNPRAKGTCTVSYSPNDSLAVINWGGISYSGQVTSFDMWKNMSAEDKTKLDVSLLDSLEEQIRNMTYEELFEMVESDDLTFGMQNGKRWESCFIIGQGTIFINGKPDTKQGYKNEIYAKDLFNKAGYKEGSSASDNYIINSRYGHQTTIWVDLGIDLGRTKEEVLNTNKVNLKDKVSNAIVYVNGGSNGSGQFGKYDVDGGVLDLNSRAAGKREWAKQ